MIYVSMCILSDYTTLQAALIEQCAYCRQQATWKYGYLDFSNNILTVLMWHLGKFKNLRILVFMLFICWLLALQVPFLLMMRPMINMLMLTVSKNLTNGERKVSSSIRVAAAEANRTGNARPHGEKRDDNWCGKKLMWQLSKKTSLSTNHCRTVHRVKSSFFCQKTIWTNFVFGRRGGCAGGLRA